MSATQLIDPDLTSFVDGSCYKDRDGLKAGYAVIQ